MCLTIADFIAADSADCLCVMHNQLVTFFQLFRFICASHSAYTRRRHDVTSWRKRRRRSLGRLKYLQTRVRHNVDYAWREMSLDMNDWLQLMDGWMVRRWYAMAALHIYCSRRESQRRELHVLTVSFPITNTLWAGWLAALWVGGYLFSFDKSAS